MRAVRGAAVRACVIATASASVASARGSERKPINPCTMRATCALSARPEPVTVFLTKAGAYDATVNCARPITAKAMPRAWASANALRGF